MTGDPSRGPGTSACASATRSDGYGCRHLGGHYPGDQHLRGDVVQQPLATGHGVALVHGVGVRLHPVPDPERDGVGGQVHTLCALGTDHAPGRRVVPHRHGRRRRYSVMAAHAGEVGRVQQRRRCRTAADQQRHGRCRLMSGYPYDNKYRPFRFTRTDMVVGNALVLGVLLALVCALGVVL